MTRCPSCECSVPFRTAYLMLVRMVDTIRCDSCGVVLTFSQATRLLQGVHFALVLVLALYAAFVEEYFGTPRDGSGRFYAFGLTVAILGVSGSAAIALVARVRGPVAEPTCRMCGADLTGTHGFRCFACGKALPQSMQPFIHRLWLWLLPLLVLAGLAWLFLTDAGV